MRPRTSPMRRTAVAAVTAALALPLAVAAPAVAAQELQRTAAVTDGSTLPPPTQLQPAEATTFTHYPRTTRLTWAAVSRATQYRVDVQCLHCEQSGQWSSYTGATVTGTSWSFTWVGDNRGRWRVTAVDKVGVAGIPSGWRTFSYATGGTSLPAPVLVSPADGTVFDFFPRRTVLVWGPVEGAAAYVVEREYCQARCADDAVPYASMTVTDPTFTFDFIGAQPGRWRVTALTAEGAFGATSAWQGFRYTR